jgi:hypothetical protein
MSLAVRAATALTSRARWDAPVPSRIRWWETALPAMIGMRRHSPARSTVSRIPAGGAVPVRITTDAGRVPGPDRRDLHLRMVGFAASVVT